MAKETLVLEIRVKGGKLAARELKMNTARLKEMKAGAEGAALGMTSITKAIAPLIGAAGLMMLSRQMAQVTAVFVKAADTAEQYSLRLGILLRSTEEGVKLFKDLRVYAGKVPFELEHIMESATTLSGVMKGGSEEIKKWIPLIGDLGAVAGMNLREVMGQFVRMYSAGANTADMFRERGILTMLGFQNQVKITAEETRDHLWREWTKADSKFRGATDKLAATWDGLMSIMKDAWFLFRLEVMDEDMMMFLKGNLRTMIDMVRTMADMVKYAKLIGQTVMFYNRGYAVGGDEGVPPRGGGWKSPYSREGKKIPGLEEWFYETGLKARMGRIGGRAPGMQMRGVPSPVKPPSAAEWSAGVGGRMLEGAIGRGAGVGVPDIAGSEQALAAEVAQIEKMQGMLTQGWMMVGDSVQMAFANMASGAMGAGDSIKSAMLGALASIAGMYGRFLMLAGLGFSALPGGWGASQAITAGAALQMLAGVMGGLAGGRGGGRGVGGYGGGGTPYASRGGGSTSSPQIIIIQSNGQAVRGQGNPLEVATRAGVNRETINVMREQIRTTGSY